MPTGPAPKPSKRSIGLITTLLVATIGASSAFAQRYLPTDIVIPEGSSFTPKALGDSGQVAGGYTPPGGNRQPAVWNGSGFTLLPLLPGAVSGWARGLNNVGQVVGSCPVLQPTGSYLDRACIWEDGVVRELPLPGGAASSMAVGINDAGNVVGHAFSYDGSGSSAHRDAVVWKGASVAKLVPPVADAQTFATAIDNSGRIAVVWSSTPGYSIDSGWGYRARWTPDVPNGTTGTMAPLTLYGAPSSGPLADINNTGAVCGDTYVWYGTEASPLYYPSWHAYAYGINDAGTIVGDLEQEGFWYMAGVWEGGSNYARDLNTLLAASTSSTYPGNLWSGLAVNNAGQILVQAGVGYSLLTPTAEPPALEPPVVNVWAHQGGIQLYWTGLDGDWSYRLKRSTVSAGPYSTIATVTDASTGWPNYCAYLDTTAAPGVPYYYVVSAVDGPVESANSAEVTAMVPVPTNPPAAPTNLRAKALKNRVQLTWNQSTSPEVVANRVYRSLGDGSYTQIAQVDAGASYTDYAVSRRTTYYYKVTAVNAGNLESLSSNVASARVR